MRHARHLLPDGQLLLREPGRTDRRGRARLARLILDVWEEGVTDFPYDVDDFPREALLGSDAVLDITATISWAALGVAVWRSGRHTPSKGITELERLAERFIDAHTENMIALVIESRPS